MSRERLEALRKPILLLYGTSFLLPASDTTYLPGAYWFVMSLYMGLRGLIPALLVGWAANPLGWLGFLALKNGRFGRAASFGLAAFLSSLLPLLFVTEMFANSYQSAGLLGLLKLSGILAWIGSFCFLAILGFLGLCLDGSGHFRLQIRISWLLTAIAIIAVLLATLPVLKRIISWSLSAILW